VKRDARLEKVGRQPLATQVVKPPHQDSRYRAPILRKIGRNPDEFKSQGLRGENGRDWPARWRQPRV